MTSQKLHPTKHQVMQGDVVLLDFPFSHQKRLKRRPAVVMSGKRYHAYYPDVILAAISGQVNAEKTNLDYTITDWRLCGLVRPSKVKMVVGTFHPNVILGKLGRMDNRDFRTLLTRFKRVFEIKS